MKERHFLAPIEPSICKFRALARRAKKPSPDDAHLRGCSCGTPPEVLRRACLRNHTQGPQQVPVGRQDAQLRRVLLIFCI